jgi:hypothetical protein
VGETWRQLIAKVMILLAGAKAKEACGVDQLHAGLGAGVEGGSHAIQLLWESRMKQEDEWGFLLIDANNAFSNEGNQMEMLWTIHHEWPSGARFTFNCYKHWMALECSMANIIIIITQ